MTKQEATFENCGRTDGRTDDGRHAMRISVIGPFGPDELKNQTREVNISQSPKDA